MNSVICISNCTIDVLCEIQKNNYLSIMLLRQFLQEYVVLFRNQFGRCSIGKFFNKYNFVNVFMCGFMNGDMVHYPGCVAF